ncbi:MAG TPA: PTS fructose transporter subunit IIB [Holophaga sp.]|nr:PTS fructose transporter subunit IIB [Holophaga sp.]
MNIIAITACPTGIAHTYMAAEQLERVGKQLGHRIKVETQGAMGLENRLEEADVAAADVLILAADIAVEGRDRFRNVPRVLEVPVQLAIRNPAEIFAKLDA